MVVQSTTPPHRSSNRNITSSGDAPNEVERLKISRFRPANGRDGLFDGDPLQTWLDAVDDQRMILVNVLGIVHCMSASFADSAGNSAPEISAAFDLLEKEIQRVVAGLEKAAICEPG
jgi:hypothetical protein